MTGGGMGSGVAAAGSDSLQTGPAVPEEREQMGFRLASSGKAVFVSYASEDAEAAHRLAESLKSAGIEVWFDQSELRGGDAWDRLIRQRIRDCRLFVAVISKHTEARGEGYFRLEWRLAVERSLLMADDEAFLLPVVVDGISEQTARVPDRFRQVQWTHLPGGKGSDSFTERVERLLSAMPDPPDSSAHLTRLEARRAGISPTAQPAVAGSARQLSTAPAGGTRLGMIAGGVVLAALLVLGWFILRTNKESPAGVAAKAGSAAGGLAATDASIAVLPFANESGDAGQQYFSDGVSEDLITALGKFHGLKVIGRTSAFQFRDTKEDSRSIGLKLGVKHLLEGSVRRAGDTIRVSAELIDAGDGHMEWSDRYDRPYKDLFSLQDEITRAVSAALRTQLLPEAHAEAQSDRPPSGNLEAYNAVLEGRFYQGQHSDPTDHKAIESFTRATEIDPNFALAWSELSRSWTGYTENALSGAAAQEGYRKARDSAERALRLAPDLAAGHEAHGFVLLTADYDWHGAEAEYRRALELAPDDAQAKFDLGSVLATLGDVESAVRLTAEAIAHDPVRAPWYNWIAQYQIGLNHLDEADRAVRRAIELAPSGQEFHTTLATIEILRDRTEAALAAAAAEPPGLWKDIVEAFARQIGGDRKAADAALARLIQRRADSAAYQIAEAYAVRRDANKTFEWLERALANRDPGIAYLLYDPLILRFRDDPRLAALCRKVGLPTPSEVAGHKSA